MTNFLESHKGHILCTHIAGHKVYDVLGWDIASGDKLHQTFFYSDIGELVDWDKPRPCKKCGQHRTEKGHDACIADLPGVKFACCGHGFQDGYIQFEDGRTWRGGELDDRKEAAN
jgi:hypothetical protein